MRQSRRNMIKKSTLAVAGGLVAQPWAIGGSAGRSVNDKIRIAILGVNGRGKEHMSAFGRLYKSQNVEIVAICDPDEAVGMRAVESVAKSFGNTPKFVKDLRAINDDKGVDVVSIATPNHWHSLAAIWAMQAGKDVYCEKPVSHNVSEGRRVVQVARKLNRICQTGTQVRSSLGIQEAVKFVHGGGIGEVDTAYGLCYKSRPSIGKVSGPQEPPKSMDYDLWCGPGPKTPPHRKTKNGTVHYDWHWTWDFGNGDLGNQGIHQMDIARWFLNCNQLADSVMSVGGRFGYVDDGETPNTQIVAFGFGTKKLIFEVRGLKTPKWHNADVGIVVKGKDAWCVVSSYSKAAVFSHKGELIKEFTEKANNHFGNFLDVVRNRDTGKLAADIEEGHLSSALCHLGNISYRLGQTGDLSDAKSLFVGRDDALESLDRMTEHLGANGVTLAESKLRVGQKLTLNPAKESFVDNSAADAMLTRPYRAPFIVPEANAI